jgi:hypothetical protein
LAREKSEDDPAFIFRNRDIRLVINHRSSSTVCNMGRNVSSRNEAEKTFAIASASQAVARRNVKRFMVSFDPSDLQRAILRTDQSPFI